MPEPQRTHFCASDTLLHSFIILPSTNLNPLEVPILLGPQKSVFFFSGEGQDPNVDIIDRQCHYEPAYGSYMNN